jgi:hypothetical protein
MSRPNLGPPHAPAFGFEMMPERQREGIARAKAEGKYKGRKPAARGKAQDAVRLFRVPDRGSGNPTPLCGMGSRGIGA